MAEKKLCANCFLSINSSDNVCSHCKHNNDVFVNQHPLLKENTKLMDRYIIGTYIKITEHFLIYNGYDTHLKTNIVIKEFFPQNICVRDGLETKLKSKNNYMSYKNLFSECKEFYEKISCIDSHNIEKIYNNFVLNGSFFIIFKKYNYITLEEYLNKRDKKIHFKTAIKIINDIGLNIETIHSEGLIHGHLNTNNICLDDNGSIVIKDFLSLNNSINTVNKIDKGFLAPEQLSIHNIQGTFTDVYSLALLFIRMVTNKDCHTIKKLYIDDISINLSVLDGYEIEENIKSAIKNAVFIDINNRTNSILQFLKDINKGVAINNKYLSFCESSVCCKDSDDNDKNIKDINKKHFLIILLVSIISTFVILLVITLHLLNSSVKSDIVSIMNSNNEKIQIKINYNN